MLYYVPFIFILNFLGPLSASQDNGSFVCQLTDAPNQCGAFCLDKLDVQLLEFKKRLNGTEVQLQMFETKMEAQLKEFQNKSENQLLALENQHSAFQKTLLETQSDIYHKITHPKFERIGLRYFYIEHDSFKTRDGAAETCRGMGGYLAAFKTQEELTAIMPKLNQNYDWYWTGMRHLKEDGKLISTASGKTTNVFKWWVGEPSNNGNCVYLRTHRGEIGMGDYHCSYRTYFICQSDNET